MGQYYATYLRFENGDEVLYNPHRSVNVEIGDYPFEVDPRWIRKDGTVFNGMKLMEHSYSGNDYVLGILAAIENRPARVAHVGDYADFDSDFTDVYTKRIYDMAWGNDYAEFVKVFDAYNPKASDSGFVVNHTKGIYNKRPGKPHALALG